MPQWERFRIKNIVFQFYSHGRMSCELCGEDDLDVLTIDHKDGNGADHRRKINAKGGDDVYLWLYRNKFPDGFRVLCRNCQRREALRLSNIKNKLETIN